MRWAIGVCVVIAVAVAAGFHWRLPLAGAVLRVGLDQAGIHGAILTANALSTSQIHLTDVSLGSELDIGSIEADFDLSRLPENPFTRLAFDGVRIDLTGTDRTLRHMSGDRRDGATPATIRALIDRVAGLPAVAVKDLSLRYAPAGSAVTLAGSAEADPQDDGAYAVRLAMQLSGKLAGKARAIALNGAARIATDAMTAEIRAKTADGAMVGMLTWRADISSDHAVVNGGVRLKLRDPGSLSELVPVLEGASGRVEIAARTTIPLSIGLDTPLGLPWLAAALQRAGAGGVTLTADIEDGSHVTGLQGVNGTFMALVRSMPDASDQLRVDGKLSLRAKQLNTASVTVEGAELKGAVHMTRRDNNLTLVFPNPVRISATKLSSKDRAISVSPVAMTLSSGRIHVPRVGLEKTDRADLRLKLEVDAAQARLMGDKARQIDLASFTLHVAGTADQQSGINGQFKIPKLSLMEKNRIGVIDDLAIVLRLSGTSATGNVRGRISALEGNKPLLYPILVESDLSLWRDILAFDSKAILPGLSVASAK
ncbi:MAG: hypothetical protein HQ514_17375, partial [Rhodospirillales bacterium]|nr:hypothetical protein [Rhodospirillales bacterium]